MAKNPFDVEERERLRFAYLKALYDKEQREQTSPGVIIRMDLAEVVNILGITETQAGRIMTALESEGLIAFMGGTLCSLSEVGREMVEDQLYDESALGKRRKIVGAIKEKAIEGASSLASKAIGGIAIYLAGVLSGYYGPLIANWLKGLFGIK